MTMMDGILLLDKAKGVSSFKATRQARSLFGNAPAGHGGTLDPLAEGLLPIFLGIARKFVRYSLESDKSYTATIQLGLTTTTDDILGQTQQIYTGNFPTIQEIQLGLASLTGWLDQLPPQFSAVHVQGQRAYQLARQGLEVELATRRVRVEKITLQSYRYPYLSIKVDCSKGTYIRSLARDLGQILGTGATLAQLRREAIGRFKDHPMYTLVELQQLREDGKSLDDVLLKPDTCLDKLPRCFVSPLGLEQLYNGIKLDQKDIDQLDSLPSDSCQAEDCWRIYDREDRFFGLLAQTEDGLYRSVRLLPCGFYSPQNVLE